MFIAPCAVDVVGAIIDRPHGKMLQIRRNTMRNAMFACRALPELLLRCPKFSVRDSLTKFRPLPLTRLPPPATGGGRLVPPYVRDGRCAKEYVGAFSVALWCDRHRRSTYFDSLRGAPRPLRHTVTNSPRTNANTKLFSARAIDARPYVVHGALPDKQQGGMTAAL